MLKLFFILILFMFIWDTIFPKKKVISQYKKDYKFQEAVQNCNFYMAEKWAKLGANVDKNIEGVKYPIHWAVYHTKDCKDILKILKIFIDKKANLEIGTYLSGDKPLHIASENFLPEAVDYLLAHGANVNALNRDGETALFKTNIDVAKILIDKYHININIKNKYNQTALDSAAERYYCTLVNFLIKKGAKPSQDKFGVSTKKVIKFCSSKLKNKKKLP